MTTFLGGLRRETNYPTFRGFVGLVLLAAYVAALVVAAVGLMTGNSASIALSIAIAVAIVLFGHVSREISLMFADIADAAVAKAAMQKALLARGAPNLAWDDESVR